MGWLNPVFKALTTIGDSGAVWLVAALLVALALRRFDVFLLVATADLVAQLAAAGIKDAVDRARPTYRPLISEPGSPAFPSGHAVSSFACAAVLTWMFPRLAAPVFLLAAAISYSRVYVGVHFPLDVIAGAALGLALATTLLLLAGVLRRSPAEPPAG